MIEKIEEYWADWQPPPLDWYRLSANVADSYSPETKVLQQRLMKMCPLRRWLSFRMRRELCYRKTTEFMYAIVQAGKEALERMNDDHQADLD